MGASDPDVSPPSAPGTPSPPMPTPTPGTGPQLPPPRRGSSRRGLGVAVVVAVVLVAAVALVATGVIPLASNSTSPGHPVDYASAATAANSSASSSPGGPWKLVLVQGVQVSAAYAAHLLPTGCLASSGTGNVSVPASSGNYTSGTYSSWFFGYINSAGAYELVAVTNGAASVVAVATGNSCGTGIPLLNPIPPGVEDSTTVAARLQTVPAVRWMLQNHSSANSTMSLLNPTSTAPLWIVALTTCGVPTFALSGPSEGATAEVEVGALNGSVLGSTYDALSACPSLGHGQVTPIGSAFAAGAPVASTCPMGDSYAVEGCAAGDYTYALTVESSTVEFGDVLFEVKTATGLVDSITGSGGFSLVGITGSVAAQSSAGSSLAMTNPTAPWSTYGSGDGPTTPLTTLYEILIDMGPSNPAGTGLVFLVLGTGTYSGSTSSLSLP